jgi:hypothetical protein
MLGEDLSANSQLSTRGRLGYEPSMPIGGCGDQ